MRLNFRLILVLLLIVGSSWFFVVSFDTCVEEPTSNTIYSKEHVKEFERLTKEIAQIAEQKGLTDIADSIRLMPVNFQNTQSLDEKRFQNLEVKIIYSNIGFFQNLKNLPQFADHKDKLERLMNLSFQFQSEFQAYLDGLRK